MPNENQLPIDILINKEHLMDPIDYTPLDLFETDDNRDNFHGYDNPELKPTISETIRPYFEEMKAAFDTHFKTEESKMIVDSGFRSYEYQQRIYMQKAREMSEEILGIKRPKTEPPSDVITKIGELIFKIAVSSWNSSPEDETVVQEFRKGIESIGVLVSQIKDPKKTSKTDVEIANEIFKKTKEEVAFPGSSEHQTGLAFDVAFFRHGKYVEKTTDNDLEIIWLMENSWRYGFVLRYPRGKENITGYKFERWHYRFVGKTIAEVMFYENLTLEEYHEKYKNVRKNS